MNAATEMYSKIFSLLRSAEAISPPSNMLGVSLIVWFPWHSPTAYQAGLRAFSSGPSASLMLALPQRLSVLFLSYGSQWTHPFEMVDPPVARSRPLGKVVDRNYSSEGMVKRRRANDTTCARAAVPKRAAQLVHKTQARNRKCD